MTNTSIHSVSRRRVASGLAAAVLSGVVVAGVGGPALAQAGSIRVDTSPLAAAGLGRYSDRVAAAMRAALLQAYGGGLRGGQTLTVRIDHVQMAAFAGAIVEDDGGGTAMHDYMQGEGILRGARGEVLGAYPILASLDASSGGAWYAPDNEEKRLAALSVQFASWMRRYTGA